MITEVWRLHGMIGSEPGLLHHHPDGTVELQLDDGDALQSMFRTALTGIGEVRWPRTQFSGGCSFVVDGEKYRLSFLQPQNTRPLSSGAYSATQGLGSIAGGRKAGKAWKAILADAS